MSEDFDKKLKWGILGAARVNEKFLPAIIEANNSEVIAVASRRGEAAQEMLAKYAPNLTNVTIYNSLDALINDSNVQAVYVPLANEEHAYWALKAIGAGKHVLIEKPLALDPDQITEIDAAADLNQVKVMEGFMYVFHPQHTRIQEIIESGMLGEIKSARATYSFMMKPERLYRIERSVHQGGGVMWDIGPYAIHSLRSCLKSAPKFVTATSKYINGADVSTSAIIEFEGGKIGTFDVSFECNRKSEFEIIGTRGGLKCHTVWQQAGDIPTITWWTDSGIECHETLPYTNHFVFEIEHFSECVLYGTVPKLTIKDAKENCKTIIAVLKSASEGRRIFVD